MYRHNKEKYLQHLESDYWQRVRRAAYRNQSGVCPVCNKELDPSYWETHHKTYRHLHEELDHMETVVAVHPECHDVLHGRRGMTWGQLAEMWKRLKT